MLAVWEDDEGWGLLGMERTQRFVVPPRLLEWNIRGYDLDDVEPFLDFVNNAHWYV